MTFFILLHEGYCYSTCGVNGSAVKVPQCDYKTLSECRRGAHCKSSECITDSYFLKATSCILATKLFSYSYIL